jgi:hypothetical protein
MKNTLFLTTIILLLIHVTGFTQNIITPKWKANIQHAEDGDFRIMKQVSDHSNIYLTGEYTGAYLIFNEDIKLENTGAKDFFIAKLNAQGKFDWVKSAKGKGSEYGTSIVVDPDGNVFVRGGFSGRNMFFDEDNKLGSFKEEKKNVKSYYVNGNPTFLAKYSNDGRLLWVEGKKVYTDPRGKQTPDCYGKDGVYFQVQSFTARKDPNIVFRTNGGRDLLIKKKSPDGTELWTNHIKGDGEDETLGAIVSSEDNVIISIVAKSRNVDFGNNIPVENPKGGYGGTIVAKYDSEGQVLWATHVSFGRAALKLKQLIVDENGDIYGKSSNAIVVKISKNGEHLWTNKVKGIGYDYLTSIYPLEKGKNLLVSGSFKSSFWPHPWFEKNRISPRAVNRADMFLAELNPETGQIQRFMQFANKDAASGMVLQQDENITISTYHEAKKVFYNIAPEQISDEKLFSKYTF